MSKVVVNDRALELFERSLDIPEADREQWLAAQVGSDAKLAQAVARLTEADRQFSSFLEPEPSALQPVSPGVVIGRWTIQETLAQGGMGVVYLASRSDGAYEQPGAIKLIRNQILNPLPGVRAKLNERFDTERQVLAQIDHENVARILDGGTTPSGVSYLVMEYVDGIPITDYCRTHDLTLNARLGLMLQLLDALAAVHRNLVVHRDIKPSNIFVTRDGRVKLLDFGIAKVVQSQVALEADQTRTNLVAFTPDYASPEQVRGEAITTSSDIYSAGMLLYQLITGHKAYTVSTTSPSAAERVICETSPALPSTRLSADGDQRAPAINAEAVAGDIDQIVMKALRKDADRRYGSAAEMAADINNYMRGMPVQAHADSPWYRFRKFVSRHRISVSLVGLVFALLTGALSVVIWQYNKANRAADLADASKRFLVELLSSATPYSDDHAVTLLDAIDLAESRISIRFVEQPELEANLRQAIGMAYQSLGRAEEGEVQLRRALAIRQPLGNLQEIAESTHGLGLTAWWKADYAVAESRFREALRLTEQLADRHELRLYGLILNDLGTLLVEMGQPESGLTILQQARDWGATGGVMDNASRTGLLSNLAAAHTQLGNNEEASRLLLEAIDLSQGSENPDFAVYLNNYGNLLIGSNQAELAVPYFQQAIDLHRDKLGNQTELVVIPLINLSRAQRQSRQPEASLETATKAVEAARTTMDSSNPMIGRSLVIQALAAEALGAFQLARNSLIEARLAYASVETLRADWQAEIDEISQRLAAELD